MDAAKQEPIGWAIIELMGHVKLAGLVSEENRFGVVLGRIDIPAKEESEKFTTQYFSGSSIYRVTPTTELIARSMAKANQPTPAHRWELPQLQHGFEDQDEQQDMDEVF